MPHKADCREIEDVDIGDRFNCIEYRRKSGGYNWKHTASPTVFELGHANLASGKGR